MCSALLPRGLFLNTAERPKALLAAALRRACGTQILESAELDFSRYGDTLFEVLFAVSSPAALLQSRWLWLMRLSRTEYHAPQLAAGALSLSAA